MYFPFLLHLSRNMDGDSNGRSAKRYKQRNGDPADGAPFQEFHNLSAEDKAKQAIKHLPILAKDVDRVFRSCTAMFTTLNNGTKMGAPAKPNYAKAGGGIALHQRRFCLSPPTFLDVCLRVCMCALVVCVCVCVCVCVSGCAGYFPTGSPMMTFRAPASSSWAQTTSWVLHEDKGVLSGEDEDWDEEKIEELVIV